MLTVVTAANNFKLATVTQLKADLGITGSSQDSALGEAIDQASAAIATWCRRVFAIETVQETLFRNAATPTVVLSRYPVISLTTLDLGDAAIDAEDDVLVDAEKGLLYQPAGALWAAGTVVAAYAAGYLLPGEVAGTDDDPAESLPADLQRACLTLATRTWHGHGRDPALKSFTYSDGSQGSYGFGAPTDSSGMPTDIAATIAAYRRPVV